MCTVTLVPLGRGGSGDFRLACNRDESLRRPSALPPRMTRSNGRIAVMPIDPVSAGTWVAMNDAGLALALLNVSGWSGTPRASRGLVIPSLLCSATLDEAATQAFDRVDPRAFPPFRLVVTDGAEIIEIHSNGARLRSRRSRLGPRPRIFTSSGLGDQIVEAPRTRLFEAFFLAAGDMAGTQDAFHRHSWPERPHLSVCMKRPEARTVSYTVIEVRGGSAVLKYFPEAPDRGPAPITARLAVRRRAAGRNAAPRLIISPVNA